MALFDLENTAGTASFLFVLGDAGVVPGVAGVVLDADLSLSDCDVAGGTTGVVADGVVMDGDTGGGIGVLGGFMVGDFVGSGL